MPCLKWSVPVGKPRTFPIFKRITSIGSSGGNDVSIEDGGLADYHAQIVFDGRDFNLSEVDTQGKILVNGKKKRRSKLIHNDRVTLADVELTFSLYDEASASAPEESAATELSGLRKLYEFSQRLMELKSVSALLEALMDAVVEVTSADKGFLILIEAGDARVAVARNLTHQNLPNSAAHLS